MWGRRASRLPIIVSQHQAGFPVFPEARCLCYDVAHVAPYQITATDWGAGVASDERADGPLVLKWA